LLDAVGGRRTEPARIADGDFPDVLGVEAVHVLGGIDTPQHVVLADLRRQRQLDQDPVDLVIQVQPLDQGEEIPLRRLLGKLDRLVVEPRLVTELLPDDPVDVLACGPEPMLEAVRARAPRAQLAWEAPMACGYGACFGCVVEIDGTFRRLCVDGPVLRDVA